MMVLAASLMGIALVDSLNPSLFIAQFYLFTTPNPSARIASYIAGIITANYIGGLLLLTGLGSVITGLIAQIPPAWGNALLIALGLALLVFGIRYKAEPQQPDTVQQPRAGGLIAAYGFGIIVMGQELTTAMPYFVALERIASAQMSLPQNLLALALYNFIFAIPLFAFLALFMRFRGRFVTQLARVTEWIYRWTPRVMRWAALIFGAVLVVSGLNGFINGG